MSFGVALEHICPHLVVQERLELETDKRSLRPKRPPANAAVKLYVNGFFIDQDNTEWGYDLIKDPQRIYGGKKVYFRKKVKSQINLFELTYYTTASNCRRCSGLRIEQDFYFNPLGRVVVLENEQKLLQDLQKFTFTEKGSNIFHLYIVTKILESIGSKLVDSSFTELTITQEIIESLQNLKDLQIQQEALQIVTDREFLYRVASVEVNQNEIDPSIFTVLVTAVNRAGETATFQQDFHIPGPENLLYGDPRAVEGDTDYLGLYGTP